MNNNKTTKRALLSSVLALVLCMVMLIGTTFAWFTDSVTSSNNIIQSGTLDVALEYKEMDQAEYKDASKGAIFDYKLWEPGYVDVKHVKISNNGTLALKYQLNVIANIVIEDNSVNLADVIDVYMFEGAKTLTSDELANATSVGTLSSLMKDADGAAYGFLLADKNIEVTIALKMKESAGNEYQNLSVGDGFAVQLLATQYTEESDAFGSLYDTGATFDTNQAVPLAIVKKATDLVNRPTTDLAWNNSYSMVNAASGVEFDTAYVFTAPVDGNTAAESPYASWLADFAVSFNRDVTAVEEVGIAGEYGPFGWIGFLANDDLFNGLNIEKLEKDVAYDLLGSFGFYMDYEDLCSLVQKFTCSAWAGEAAEGLTMTVELRLYETYSMEESAEHNGGVASANVKTGNYVVIGTYDYTF